MIVRDYEENPNNYFGPGAHIKFRYAALDGSPITGNFIACDFFSADFRHCDLSGATFVDCTFRFCDLRGVKGVTEETFKGCEFANCHINAGAANIGSDVEKVVKQFVHACLDLKGGEMDPGNTNTNSNE